MEPGRLRDSITWQTATNSQNAYGETTETWSTLFASVPCEVKSASGKEQYAMQQAASEITHLVKCRYIGTLTTKCRGLWRGRYLYIESIAPDRTHSREMTVRCKEDVD